MSSNAVELEANFIQRVVDRRDKILANSRERAARILDKAREEAARIQEVSKQQVKEIMSSRFRTIRERVLGEAEMEGRRRLMSVRDEIISSVFEEYFSRIKRLAMEEETSDAYGRLLMKLIKEAAESLGGDSFIIYANSRDTKHLRKDMEQIKKKLETISPDISLKLSDQPIDCIGGVIIENDTRTKIYYNTLESRVIKARKLHSADVARILGVI